MQHPVSGHGARIFVVDEGDVVADEAFIFDGDAIADKRVAGDLAIFPVARAFLNPHKCADFGIVADFTAIQICQRVNASVFPELDVFGGALLFHDGFSLINLLLLVD